MARTTRTYTGTSRASYQEALERAIASALRTAGADRTVRWSVKSVSGTAGGIAPRPQVKVAIEATID
jgi:hypothetical protein